jgi:hypothetical protein
MADILRTKDDILRDADELLSIRAQEEAERIASVTSGDAVDALTLTNLEQLHAAEEGRDQQINTADELLESHIVNIQRRDLRKLNRGILETEVTRVSNTALDSMASALAAGDTQGAIAAGNIVNGETDVVLNSALLADDAAGDEAIFELNKAKKQADHFLKSYLESGSMSLSESNTLKRMEDENVEAQYTAFIKSEYPEKYATWQQSLGDIRAFGGREIVAPPSIFDIRIDDDELKTYDTPLGGKQVGFWGWSTKEQVASEQAIFEPLVSPLDLAPDLVFARLAAKLATRAGAKGLTAAAGDFVLSQVANVGMIAADSANANQVTSLLAGVLSPMGAMALVYGGKRTTISILKKMKATDPAKFKKVWGILQGGDVKLNRAMADELDTKTVEELIAESGDQLTLPGFAAPKETVVDSGLSAGARTAATGVLTNDQAAQDAVTNAVVQAVRQNGDATSTVTAKALDTGDAVQLNMFPEDAFDAVVAGTKQFLDTGASKMLDTYIPPSMRAALIKKVESFDDYETMLSHFVDNSIPSGFAKMYGAKHFNIPEAPPLTNPITDMAQAMQNVETIQPVAGRRIFFTDQTSRQQIVEDIIAVRVLPDKTHTLSMDIPVDSISDQQVSRVRDFLDLPVNTFKEWSQFLVKNPTMNGLHANRLKRAFKQAQENVIDTLSNRQKAQLQNALETGAEAEERLIAVEGGLYSPSQDKVLQADADAIDAYYATRNMLDATHMLVNDAAKSQAHARGMRMMELPNGVRVRVDTSDRATNFGVKARTLEGETITWTAATKKAGEFKLVKAAEEDVEEFFALTNTQFESIVKDFSATDVVIPYVEGYIPRNYKQKWAITALNKDRTGQFKAARLFTASTYHSGAKKLKRLKEKGGDTEYILSRRDAGTQDVAYSSDFAGNLSVMSKEQMGEVVNVLKKAGFKDDELDAFTQVNGYYSYKRTPWLMDREKHLIDVDTGKPAEIAPAFDALSRYFDSASEFVGHAEWNDRLVTWFKERYGKYIPQGRDWEAPLAKTSSLSVEDDLWNEAIAVQGQLKRVHGLRSDLQLKTERWAESVADRFLRPGKNRANNFAIEQAESALKFMGYGWVNKAKGVTAIAKLGLWNISQVFVQGSLVLNEVGLALGTKAGAKVLTQGTRDFAEVMAPNAFREILYSKNGQHLNQLLIKTGIVEELDWADAARALTVTGRWRNVFGKAINKSVAPWKLGEKIPRIFSFVVERRALIDQINKGQSGIFKAADIDGDEFLTVVTERALATAHNMSRFNQPAMARGLAGVPLQFKQFALHQFRTMTNTKDYSPAQLATLWATYIGAFGLSGIPIFWDVALMGEDVVADVTNTPTTVGVTESLIDDAAKTLSRSKDLESIKFWKRFVKKGGFNAATEGELDIANRVALGMLFSHYSSNTPVYDLVGGPPGQVMKQIVTGTIASSQDMMRIIHAAYEQRQLGLDTGVIVDGQIGMARHATKELLEPYSGPFNAFRAAEALVTDKITDRGGKVQIKYPSLSEVLMTGIGITPGKITEQIDKSSLNFRKMKALDDWVNERIKEIVEIKADSPESAAVYMQQARTDLGAFNPAFLKTFDSRLVWALQSAELPVESRTIMMETGNKLLTFGAE